LVEQAGGHTRILEGDFGCRGARHRARKCHYQEFVCGHSFIRCFHHLFPF
jgi:hypothetical protein